MPITLVMAGSLFYTLAISYAPILYRNLVNTLNAGGEEALQAGIKIVVTILFLNLGKNVVWRISNFANTYYQASVMRDLTRTCYEYLQKHSVNFFNSKFMGSLVTKVRRYEKSFEQITDQVTFGIGKTMVELVMILIVVFFYQPLFAGILLGWTVIFVSLVYWYTLFKLPYDIRRAQTDTQTTAQLADSMANNINIKLFTGYEKENERFSNTVQDQFVARKKSWDLSVWGDMVQGLLMILLEFGIMYLAVKLWYAGELTVGDVVLIQAYLARIFDKLWETGRNIRSIYEALADANEMTEILLEPHGIQDRPRAKKLAVDGGGIEFKDVVFGYDKEVAVLSKFNLNITPGERIAIIGTSGGGKSTIIKLLFRFHDINGGEIVIDGQNIAKVTQDSLRAAMAFVPQEPILFHRTLMENIRYAKSNATDEEVIQAAKLAHAHEFIESFREGYETLVGERGVKLSGGERQRVAIARAILKDAPILVLDEATSSLDSESEMYIQDALKKLMRDRTTIVIAHRLSTIMQMDRIVVIESGRIIEEGKHEELLKARQGTYQKLWEIQAGGFAQST